MALNNSEKDSSTPSNSSSSSKSDKASAPSPSSPSFSGDSDSPQSAPSKSPPPPPSKSPPPSPSQSTPPPPSHSPPPPTSQSPPPSPSHSPPPPPPPSPSHSTPPPSSSPPSKGSAPPPTPSSSSSSSSSPPPPPPSSTPPPPPPSPNGNSPPQQSQAPPPPDKSSPPPTPTPPSPASPVTPPATKSPISPVPPTGSGSGSNHPPPSQSPAMSAGSHTKPSGPSKSSTPGGAGDNTGEYVGYSLAGVFVVALVAVVLFFIFRKKKKRGNLYAAPYMPPPNNFNMKPDMHYYVEQPGIANGPQDGFYSSQPAHSPLGNNYGNGNHGGTMHCLSTPSDSAQPKGGQIVFSYDKVMEITNGFSSKNVIGEGGFGCVYKASLPDGRVGAVKMLKAGSGQGEREFRAEVEIISRVHHRHLVSLVGYCISEQQRVLIYEFVPNGTLDHHLHGSGLPVLDWPKRMKIAIGAAKGLAYLHDDCNPKIIHRDIKSANILLDDAYEAQVSDFGLARLTDDANTHVSTRVMGTFGYMAPEYATSGKLTDRSDVFSFGVVLLELVTGRKPVDQTQPVGDESLVEWARPLLLRAIETGDFGELVDPRLEWHYVDSEMFRMIEAAAACVRHSAPKRPRMVQVVRALDSGDHLCDLSNGVKYGQSTVYDSGQYNEDIMKFRRMANGSFGDSEFDMYSTEYSSREMSGSQHKWIPCSSSGESESTVFNSHRSNAEHRS